MTDLYLKFPGDFVYVLENQGANPLPAGMHLNAETGAIAGYVQRGELHSAKSSGSVKVTCFPKAYFARSSPAASPSSGSSSAADRVLTGTVNAADRKSVITVDFEIKPMTPLKQLEWPEAAYRSHAAPPGHKPVRNELVFWDGNGPIRIFRSGFKAVTEQLQSSYRPVTKQLQTSYKSVTGQ